jgi:hypothetical protein
MPAGTFTKQPMHEYKPLVEDDAIRVLLLYPSANVSAELKCAIEHITLSQYKKDLIKYYTALSYVWGLSTEQRHIVINGCSFYVTPNLDSALRHIRDDEGIIRVWVGAICINQQDVEERSSRLRDKPLPLLEYLRISLVTTFLNPPGTSLLGIC